MEVMKKIEDYVYIKGWIIIRYQTIHILLYLELAKSNLIILLEQND